MLILTAQRLNEVAGMRWSQVDAAKAVWSLPAESTKAIRGHEIPLTPLALSVLAAIPRTQSDFVFPARGKDGAMSGFNKRKAKLDRLSNTVGWTQHDIRRTVATGMARLRVDPHIVERLLNHKIGSISAVGKIYNQFGYLDEQREALIKWSDHLEKNCI